MVDGVQPYCMGPYTYLLGCSMVRHGSLDMSDGEWDNTKKKILDKAYLGSEQEPNPGRGLIRLRPDSSSSLGLMHV